MSALAPHESGDLARLESVVSEGLRTFVEVGAALAEIRDRRLYRAEYVTFEDYCQERWGMSRAHAYRTIAASEVVGVLSPRGDKPTSEKQVRPLTKLPPEDQPKAWEKAVEQANGKPTAAQVRAAVIEVERETRGTLEERVRDAMENGGDAGLGTNSFRRARYIVALAEDPDLSDEQRSTVLEALEYMNAHMEVGHPWRLVESIVEARFGKGGERQGRRPSSAARAVRESFERAFGAVVQACTASPNVTVPPMDSEEAARMAGELARAIKSVHEFRRNIEEAGS